MKITCKLFHLNVRTNLRNGGSTRSWKRSIHADEKKMSLPMVQPGERAESFDQPRRPWLGVCVYVRWVYDGWGWFISDGRIIMMTAIIARHPSLFRRGEAMSFPRWQPVRVVRLRRIRRICVRCEAVGLSWTCFWAAQMEWAGSMAVSVRSVMMDGAFDREARKREIFPTIILSFRWAFVTGWGLSFRLQSCRNGKGKSILLHSETETV